MTIAESILPEFDIEMAGTRKTLERVPEDKLGWKVHDKSNTIGWVACHLAEIAGWVEGTLTQDSWDINPTDGEPYKIPELNSLQAILDLFDANVSIARKRLAETPDDEFAKSWSLLSEGEALMTMPKLNVIRTCSVS